jgi:hypothetical protein
MTFHPRLGDLLLGAFALLLVIAVVHSAQTFAPRSTGVKTRVEHPSPSKAPAWPHRVA